LLHKYAFHIQVHKLRLNQGWIKTLSLGGAISVMFDSQVS